MQEIWKDIIIKKNGIIYDYTGFYQVSNLGRIKSLARKRNNGSRFYYTKEKILKPSKQKIGKYERYKIELSKNGKRTMFKVHQLVATAFIPNPENKPQINHIDGNSLNNVVSNLEWATSQENIIHSYRYLRTKNYNENELLEMYKNNISPKEICEKLKISNGVYYKVLKKYNLFSKGNKYWKNKYGIDLKELLKDFKKGLRNRDIAKKYNCSKEIIATRKYQFRKKGLI